MADPLKIPVETDAAKATAALTKTGDAVAGIGDAAAKSSGQLAKLGEAMTGGGDTAAAAKEMEAALRKLGVRSDETIRKQQAALQATLNSVRASGTASARELAEAEAAFRLKSAALANAASGASARIGRLRGAIDRLRGSAIGAGGPLSQLSGYLQAILAGLAVQRVLDYAAAWNSTTAQLRGALPATADLAKAQQDVLDLANRTGQAIEPTGKLYANLNRSLAGVIEDQGQLLTLTELINQSFVVSGTSSENAAAAILQLNQAFGSGVLRGDEFNSIMENSPRLAKALADGLSLPVGSLRKLAEDGKLTTEVVAKALLSQRDTIAAEYAKMPRSVSQSLTALRNQTIALFGRGDEATGFTKAIAGVIDLLARRLPELTPLVNAFGQALAGLFDWLRDNPGAIEAGLHGIVLALEGMIAVKLLSGVVGLGQNLWAVVNVVRALAGAAPLLAGVFTGTLVPAMAAVGNGLRALSLLFLANPIGIAILAIAAAIALAYAYWDDLVVAFRVLSANVEQIFWQVVQSIKDAFTGVRDFFVTLFTVTIPAAWAGFIARLAALFGDAKTAYAALLADIQALWTGLWEAVKDIGQAALDYLVKLFTGFLDDLKAGFASIKDGIAGLFSEDTPATGNGKAVIKRASGGLVRGPGGPRDDRVPALLSNGEYVLQAGAVQRLGKRALDALNAGTALAAPLVPSLALQSTTSSGGSTVILNIGSHSYRLQADHSTAAQLAREQRALPGGVRG